ncbi:adenylate/guanylate cyclase domain-containing protein [Roseospira marina]|uniref:Adenylate/guanylate cyclase domain-containing protein n=1 Tax=Roseospira marina TaxID=140057 RepID=A0A5M6I955_9PROT|nr:adenylate/guanylate cyclase domain-containing protein [Roseospira marina]KAA5604796.1 adenylate/guanylate cyclase domain-containing protein [Roseospira marina]MBB4313485.1 class 3 adenylate cyclase [Roseospira marina]MBB5086647.1 class 3 adenylate cyclase [Roseospira marina]
MPPHVQISLRTVLLVGFVGLVLTSAGTMLAIGAWSGNTSAHELLLQRSATVLHGLEGWVRRQLEPLDQIATATQARVADGTLDLDDPQQMDAYAVGLLTAVPRLESLAIVRPDQQVRRYRQGGMPTTETWEDRPAVAAMITDLLDRAALGETTPEWGNPVWRGTYGHTVFNIRAPLMADGAPAGVLIAMIGLAPIGPILPRLLSTDILTPYALYGRDKVLAHPLLDTGAAFDEGASRTGAQALPDLADFPDLHLATLWSAEPLDLMGPSDLKPGWAQGIQLPDTEVIHTLRQITDITPEPILVGAHFTPEQGAPAYVRLWFSIGVSLAILALSALAGLLLARSIARPVVRFARFARAVAAGDLSQDPPRSRSWIREYHEADNAVRSMIQGLRERERVRNLFGKYVPEEVARRLLAQDAKARADEIEATVLFADISAFSTLTQALGPEPTVRVLNAYFSVMVDILEQHGGVVTQFQGDAMLVAFNVPERHPDHATAAVTAAQAMMARLDAGPIEGRTLSCRIGIGTGMVLAGAVGAQDRLTYTVHGDAVNLAARLESLNKTTGTRILVSERTAALAPAIPFAALGPVSVRGRDREEQVFTPLERGLSPQPSDMSNHTVP